MENSITSQSVFRQFSTLLSYPTEAAWQTAANCSTHLAGMASLASAHMEHFAEALSRLSPSGLEEQFTRTFDLQPVCHPYVGYQLFGESQQRTLFLIRLQQLFREHGFSGGPELPDHLATLLDFVASVSDRQCGLDIVRDGILPTLDKLSSELADADTPYRELLLALRQFLSETVALDTEPLAADGRRS